MKGKILLLLFVVVFAFQCSHYDQVQGNVRESTHGSTESHEFSRDCMTCHNDKHNEASAGYKWWTIAGSVTRDDGSTPFTNGVIELWTKQDREGTLVYSIPIDELGNFYTSKILKFGGTCYPVVVNNETGNYEAMSHAFHSGGCNSCHGVTTDLIYAD